MKSIKRPFKTLGKKLELLLEAAMPCKMVKRERGRKLLETVTSESTNAHKKFKYTCIVEAHESTRKRMESTHPRKHEDRTRVQFNKSPQFGAEMYSDAPSDATSDENSGCESCSGQRMGEAREDARMAIG